MAKVVCVCVCFCLALLRPTETVSSVSVHQKLGMSLVRL